MMILAVVLIGLMGGAAAGFQAPLAGILGRHVGIGGSIFVVHVVGTVCAALFLLVPGVSTMGNWRSVPWYALLTGALGIALVGTTTFCVPRIGAASTITLMIVGSLCVGAFLDHHGLLVEQARTFDASRALGVVAVFVGTWMIVR